MKIGMFTANFLDRDLQSVLKMMAEHGYEAAELPAFVGNGHLDVDEPQTLTDVAGRYSFTLLDPSITYVVAEVPQDGWEQTYPTDLARQFVVDSSSRCLHRAGAR